MHGAASFANSCTQYCSSFFNFPLPPKPPPFSPWSTGSAWFTRQMYPSNIGLVMPIFGVFQLMGGLVVGPLIDKHGRGLSAVIITLSTTAALILTWFANLELQTWCAANVPDEELPCKTSLNTKAYVDRVCRLSLSLCNSFSLSNHMCRTRACVCERLRLCAHLLSRESFFFQGCRMSSLIALSF